MIRALIIDDEIPSLESLEIEIGKYCPEIEIVALCEGADEGIVGIIQHKPDLVFLDIEMPEMSGFELLEKVRNVPFHVIFTTAYDQYAIRAFKVSAMDYLLKPIDIEELQSAVQKVVQMNSSADPLEKLEVLLTNIKNPQQGFQKLAIPTLSGLHFVNLEEIIFCEADGNYSIVNTQSGEKHLISRPLKETEELLNSPNFFRTHQTYLVNLSQVKEYIKGSGGQLVLQNGQVIQVARARKEELMKLIYRRKS